MRIVSIVSLLSFTILFSKGEEKKMFFKLLSSSFEPNQEIPVQFTCDSDNISPALHWSGVPQKTQSFALIVDDPDAPKEVGVFVHWVIANIPATVHELQEDANISSFIAGATSFGTKKYGGPCPPSGTHRYFFKLYALDTILKVSEGVTKEELLTAMHGHILGQAELMGTYKRKK